MQPHFMPWLGYVYLASRMDMFILLNHTEFSRGTWYSRNRILDKTTKQPKYISCRLKGSDSVDIADKMIDGKATVKVIKDEIYGNYNYLKRKTENSEFVKSLIDTIEMLNTNYLAVLDRIIIDRVFEYFKVDAIVDSSYSSVSPLKSNKKVISCIRDFTDKQCTFYNGQRALDYLKAEDISLYKENGITYALWNYTPHEYNQGTDKFVSHLSCIDLLLSVDTRDEAINVLNSGLFMTETLP